MGATPWKTTLSSLLRRLVTRLGLIGWSARLGSPTMAAFFATLLVDRTGTQGTHTVLCIGRPIFNEDIHELAKFGGRLNYTIIPKAVFMTLFNHFVPALIHEHARYHEIPGQEDAKRRYRAFLSGFLTRFAKRCSVDAIMTANYNYSWQQEFVIAAREQGKPVVVLFKEGISPLYSEGDTPQTAYAQVVRKYTNNRLIADLLLVYNERIRNAFLNVAVPGVREEMIEAVGIPRFDRYFHMRSSGEDVVFFSFNFEDKARHLGLEDAEYDKYYRKADEFHAEVVRFAAAHPERRVVIKTKNHVKYLRYVEDIVAGLGLTGLPNLVVTNHGNVYQLLNQAHAVIGYNSTTLLEAYAARRIVMTADFRWGKVRDYFDEHPDVPHYVTTAEDIAAVLANVSHGRAFDDAELNLMLRERIHIPDGRASERTEAAILGILPSSRSGGAA